METIRSLLANLILVCWHLLGNYGLAIILFTLLTKIVLFPVSLWTHRNSLKMVSLMPELNHLKLQYYGDKDTIAEETQKLYKREHYHPLASTIPMLIQLLLLVGVIGAVRELLAGTESMLSVYPARLGGITLLLPLAAGCSALTLGLAQNGLNPLQREQPKASQWMTNGLSIAISLALGAFVPMGVGIYWITSNLLTILQQIILNAVMRPEKYVDYTALQESRRELAEIDSLSAHVSKEDKQREREDYKRFFSIANKHLVFYSEKSGFYKYFQDIIEYLLTHSNITIHYITSDPKDQVFMLAKTQPHIKPYYIGERKLITLMMKMDADIVVMTMPDLENFHIKRSYVRKDVEYIYTNHGIGSTNMLIRKKALAHFDTIFCIGEYQVQELRAEERVYGLPPRNLVPCGYGLLDQDIARYAGSPKKEKEKEQLLVAPSYQPDNILDSCLDELLNALLTGDYHVIVRPHPQYCKLYPQRVSEICAKYAGKPDCTIETNFASNETVFQSDLVITDWSTISYEFSFTTNRPTLFINTPMKVINPDYRDLGIEPLDIVLRDQVGKSLAVEQISKAGETVAKLLTQKEEYSKAIPKLAETCIYNLGRSGEVGGGYIIEKLIQKQSGGKTK